MTFSAHTWAMLQEQYLIKVLFGISFVKLENAIKLTLFHSNTDVSKDPIIKEYNLNIFPFVFTSQLL